MCRYAHGTHHFLKNFFVCFLSLVFFFPFRLKRKKNGKREKKWQERKKWQVRKKWQEKKKWQEREKWQERKKWQEKKKQKRILLEVLQ
jgi:hypothetical protein